VNRKLQRIHKDATIQEAADLLAKQGIGVLPVFDQNKCIGVLTDRDIVIRGIAAEKDLQSKICDIMTKDVYFVNLKDDVRKVANLMKEKRVRRLLVKGNNDEVVGLVSLGDLSVICHGTEEEKYVIEALHGIHSGPASQ